MNPLTQSDLLPLERYAAVRTQIRTQLIAHKKNRSLALGRHASLLFEDRLTVHYQIQEMLRIERIFEASGIQDELDSYNPLVPDGSNLKATLLFELSDPVERAERLAQWVGIEHRVYAEVAGHQRVFARANEGLEYGRADKTAAVHFLRFEFTPRAIEDLHSGAGLAIGLDHPGLREHCPVPEALREILLGDFSALVASP